MMDYRDYDFDEFYEPSALDELLEETIDKATTLIKSRVKKEMENNKTAIQTRTTKLDERDKKIILKERELINRESDIVTQLKDIENIKLRTVIEERLYLDYFNFFTIDTGYITRSKCDKCDDDRRVQIFHADGSEYSKVGCECNSKKMYYTVADIKSTTKYVKNNKYDKYDKDNVEVYVSMIKNSWDDSYSNVVCKRVDLIKTLDQAIAKDNYYGSVFETKELTQQYCDYLNKKENK